MIATALVVWANFLPLPGYNEAAPRAHLHVLSLQCRDAVTDDVVLRLQNLGPHSLAVDLEQCFENKFGEILHLRGGSVILVLHSRLLVGDIDEKVETKWQVVNPILGCAFTVKVC